MTFAPAKIANSVLAGLAAAFLATSALAQQASRPQQSASNQQQTRQAAPQQLAQYTDALPREAANRQACEAVADRIFVAHDVSSECIAYFATPQIGRIGTAVLYFEGDVPAADLAKAGFEQNYMNDVRSVFPRLATQHGVRFVFVSRPGVFGSSGNHGQRRSAAEMLTMNVAVDLLKSRLGITNVVLAGQSGGSTIAAAMLTLGRRDVSCAVLGSGLLSVVEIEYAHRVRERLPEIRPEIMRVQLFDPTDRLSWIERQQARRIFVLGDPTDVRTPYPQQRSFAFRVRGLGHHAEAIEVVAQGELMHGVAHHTLPAAALCARGFDDASIRRTVAPAARQPAPTQTSQLSR